jgi:hypothetical protein
LECLIVDFCFDFRDLFLVSNKICVIEGLETLTTLTQLELGSNRIRVNKYQIQKITKQMCVSSSSRSSSSSNNSNNSRATCEKYFVAFFCVVLVAG